MVNQWTLLERFKYVRGFLRDSVRALNGVSVTAASSFPPTGCTCITDDLIHRVWIDGHLRAGALRAATTQSPDYKRTPADSDATAAADTQQHRQTDDRILRAAGGGECGVTHGTR